MRRYRATPAGLAAQRAAYRKHYWVAGGKERQRQDRIRRRERHFFEHRWLILHAKDESVTPMALLHLWWAQRGRCALTGVRLDRTAHLDHSVPLARGGPTSIENLQWVTPQANYAKRNYTSAEFFAICRQVVAFIGR